MPKDKKPKMDDVKKLRQILDNIHDSGSKKSVPEDNKNLESIRKRLSGEPSKTDMEYTSPDFLSKKYDSLEPRVTIHEKEKKITPSENQKFEPDERTEDVKDEFPEENLFDDVDLYEVEKVDVSELEFLEVKPKRTAKKLEEVPKKTDVFLPVPEPVKKEKDEELPEWEPIEKNKPEGAAEKKREEISESGKIEEEAKPQPTTEEKIPIWEPVSEESIKEEITELSEEEQEEKPFGEYREKVSERGETKKIKREKEQLKFRILSFLNEWKTKKGREDEKLGTKKAKGEGVAGKKFGDEIFVGGKESEANILKKLELRKLQKEAKGEGDKGVIGKINTEESAEQKSISQEPFEKIEEEAKPQPTTEEKIPIWESVSEESIKEEITELPKEKDAKQVEKERRAELKKKEKEHREKKIEEERLKKLEAKKAAKKAKEKEERRLKRIEAKKALTATREKEREAKQAEKAAKRKTAARPKLKYEDEELSEWTSYEVGEEIPDTEPHTKKPYKHGEYILYKKEIKTSAGKKRTVRFFSKKKPDIGEAVPLPEGYEVKINKRNKLPYLRKKK